MSSRNRTKSVMKFIQRSKEACSLCPSICATLVCRRPLKAKRPLANPFRSLSLKLPDLRFPPNTSCPMASRKSVRLNPMEAKFISENGRPSPLFFSLYSLRLSISLFVARMNESASAYFGPFSPPSLASSRRKQMLRSSVRPCSSSFLWRSLALPSFSPVSSAMAAQFFKIWKLCTLEQSYIQTGERTSNFQTRNPAR